jgi:hypothetical protein
VKVINNNDKKSKNNFILLKKKVDKIYFIKIIIKFYNKLYNYHKLKIKSIKL